MISRRISVLVCILLVCSAPAFAHHLAVVTHQDNGVKNLSSAELGRIFKSETKKWPDGRDIVLVLNRNSLVAMRMLERVSGMPDGKAKALIAAHKGYFVLADSDAQVLDMVVKNRGALGVVDVRAVDSRIKVLRVDGKLPLQKAYLPD